jgi:hypothetical protein
MNALVLTNPVSSRFVGNPEMIHLAEKSALWTSAKSNWREQAKPRFQSYPCLETRLGDLATSELRGTEISYNGIT